MLQIFLLGTPLIILDGERLHALTSLKSQALLYYLAMSRRPHSRLTLAGLLWPEKNDTEARTNLRQAVRQLRQAIGDAETGGYLLSTRDTVTLPAHLPIEVDASTFEWMLNAGLEGEMRLLQSAVNHYTGEFLSGLYLDDAYGYETWMLIERERLRNLSIQGLHTLAHHYATQQEISAGLTVMRRLLEIEPWREEAHRLMMQFLAWDGQTSAALAQYERCRQILKDELGVQPGTETRALYHAIQTNQIPVKNLPLAAPPHLPQHPPRPNNLPPEPAPFIGRLHELAEVKRLISVQTASETKPLLTLVGPGGVGKTRLAQQVAAELLPHFSDGVWYIELATTTDPAQIPHTLLSALAISSQTETAPLKTIQTYFASRTALLILDNCEQIRAGCADLAQALRDHCPSLTLLATSREPLYLQGETVYPVPVMDTPAPNHLPPFEDLLQYDAICLFVNRARAAWPAFPFTPATAPFIAEICQQLDGIPLAIELAAVRVNALSIEKIAERLTYRFNLLTRHPHTTLPQHQTLSALVDWSYDLLDENERTLFQRLSIFSGSWTLEAAEAICASTPEDVPYTHPLHPMDILPILTRLIDKSLVQVPEINGENTRYRYLETIRQYARQKLRASGDEPQAFNNHAHYYLRLVSEANPLLKSSEQVQWTARLYAEQDNLRSAQNWWFQTNPTNALKMAGLMGRYWDRQGLYTEGRETLEKALSTSQNAPLPDRIKALKWASGLAMRQANYEKGKTLAREGLELTRSQDDKVNMAAFLNILGLITSGEGNDQEAQKFIAESVALQRQLENLWGIASGLDNLSNITRALGDAPHALTYMLECLEITRKLGDKFLIANNLVGAAEIYLDLNELTTAQQHLKDAIHLQQELNDQQGMAYALGELGVIAWLQKNYATAQNFLENSLKIRQNIGDKHGEGYILYLMSLNALACEDFLLAKGYLKTGLEILWPLGEQRITLNCLEALGHVAAGIGDTTRAIKLWAATHTLREQANLQNRAIFRTFHATKLEQTRHTPGGPAFTPHWQAGISMSIEALRALANDFFAHP